MAGANTAAVDQEQGQEQDEEMWEEGEDGEGENDGEGEEVGERDDGRRGDGEGEDDEEDSDEFVLAELLALNGWFVAFCHWHFLSLFVESPLMFTLHLGAPPRLYRRITSNLSSASPASPHPSPIANTMLTLRYWI